jgi:hypothetical protein
MGRFFAAAAVLVASLAWAGSARAQQQPPADPCAAVCPPAPPCVCPPPAPYVYAPVPPPPPPARPSEEPFALDLIGGQQTGLRGQVALFRTNAEAFVVEGFVGELFTNIRSSFALGAGARYLFQTPLFDGVDAVLYGPGLNVYFLTDNNGPVLLTPSFDVSYLYQIDRRLQLEVGLDAGLGIGVSGRTKNNNSAAGDVTTLISVYAGIRF